MYEFLCQKIDGEIPFDFVFGIREAVKFVNWYNGEEVYHIRYIEDFSVLDKVPKTMIPVGSVEFVEEFYRKYHNVYLKPINLPPELRKYALRDVWDGTHLDERKKELFCKSNDKTKGFTDVITPDFSLKEGRYQFSELIDIKSEWRCFVHRGELLAIHNYHNSIEEEYFPSVRFIKRMIGDYDKLSAYTLDIGVNDEVTFPIEVHDFYSCGLYGFADYNNLIKMHIDSHKEKLIKCRDRR